MLDKSTVYVLVEGINFFGQKFYKICFTILYTKFCIFQHMWEKSFQFMVFTFLENH